MSCNKLIFREVICREFEQTTDLEWFAGNIGDSIVLVENGTTRHKFKVYDKYILHRKKYKSDTGCGCHDMWGATYVSGQDSIGIWTEEKYVEKKTANRYETLPMKISGISSGFIEEDVQSIGGIVINGVSFNNIRKYSYQHSEPFQFKTIYVAPKIGILQMERVNGDIWTNQYLSNTLNSDKSTYIVKEYYECK